MKSALQTFSQYNSNTVNKRRVAEIFLSQYATIKPGLIFFPMATVEIQVYPSGSNKRRRRSQGAATEATRRYDGAVTLKGSTACLKQFRPGTMHIIDVNRIKLNADDVHGDGVHSVLLIIWDDGSVERYDPFCSSASRKSIDMQEFLDALLREWLQSLSHALNYKPFSALLSDSGEVWHGAQFIEYVNGQARTSGEHFCYVWCVLCAIELLYKGSTSVSEAHRGMFSDLGLASVSTNRIDVIDSAACLTAIREVVRRNKIG